MIKVCVYLDNGCVFSYSVASPAKAREHASAIVWSGYRHCEDGELEHYPPHRILKVKCDGPGISTNYPDEASGT